jgi:mono/diheme cytochrome c family protein
MMRLITLLGLALSCAALGCARPRVFTPATDVDHVMRTMVDPAANLVWASVVTTVTIDGVREKFPKTDAEWSALRGAAADLAAAGNLLRQENRVSLNSDWGRQSQSLIVAAAATLKAVEARSPDQILAAGEQIYNTCVGCHGGYYAMTPPR